MSINLLAGQVCEPVDGFWECKWDIHLLFGLCTPKSHFDWVEDWDLNFIFHDLVIACCITLCPFDPPQVLWFNFFRANRTVLSRFNLLSAAVDYESSYPGFNPQDLVKRMCLEQLAFLTTCEQVHVRHVWVPSSAKSEMENTTKVVF